MIKIKNILLIVCATLFFVAAFIAYNNHHIHLVGSPFQKKIMEDDHVMISITASTQTYRHSDAQFGNDIISFYKDIPYDGYVTNYESNNKLGSTRGYLYISDKSNSMFLNQTFSKSIDWKTFSEKGNQAYLTDDLTDSDAFAHILPFHKFGNGKTTRFGKNMLVYTNIHNFDITKYVSKNTVVTMHFIVPTSNVEAFEMHLNKMFIMPNYECTQANRSGPSRQVCGLALAKKSKETEQEFMNKMYFNLFINSLEFPKPILFLSLVSLLGVLIQSVFKQSKELTVRNIYGNHEIKIFQRLFLRSMMSSMLYFNMTLVCLGIVVLNLTHGSTPRFIHVLFDIGLYFSVGLFILTVFFNLLMRVSLRAYRLKKTFNAKAVVVLAIITKIMLSIILSFDVVGLNHFKFSLDARLKFIENKPHLKEGYTTDIYYGTAMSGDAQRETDVWLFHTVEKYGFDFLNFSNIYEYYDTATHNTETFLYLSANRNAIRNEAIYDLNNQKVDARQLKRNTLLIPKAAKKDYEKYGFKGDVDVIYVRETGQYNATISYGAPIINAALLIVVDNPGPYVSGINAYSIRAYDRDNNLSNFYKEVDQKIGQSILISAMDLYKETKEESVRSKTELYLLSANAICMFAILTTVIITAYFESKRHELAVATTQGASYWKRYRFIIVTVYAIVTLLLCFLLMYKHQINPSSYDFNQSTGIGIFVFCAGFIDSWLLFHAIRRFERDSVSEILKGD